MAKVVWDVSMSVDGFVADPKDNLDTMFDWYSSGDTPKKADIMIAELRLSALSNSRTQRGEARSSILE